MPPKGPKKELDKKTLPPPSSEADEFIKKHNQDHPENVIDRTRVTVIDTRKTVRPQNKLPLDTHK